MDQSKRHALVKNIGDVNNKTQDLVLVELEEFFDGNDDGASIWCNLLCAPEPEEVFGKLKEIRDRDDVADVRIMVTQFDGGDDEWPFSDTIFFVTSASPEELLGWLTEKYAPDDIWEDQFDRAKAIPVPVGMRAIAAWWD